ncbi:MAG: hypothetical protein JW940_07995 [Polyangiaceae bacterium]|nr:hypothetical protein [Polyangiaceae bacterium]
MRSLCLATLLGLVTACTACPPRSTPPAQPAPARRPAATAVPAPPAASADAALGFAQDAAQAAERERWKEESAAAQRCVEASPQRADCHHRLGAALERLDQPGPALAHYLDALRLTPTEGKYYTDPVELCLAYKLYDTAAMLAAAGLARCAPESEPALALRTQQARAAEALGDRVTMTTALEQAYLFHHEEHPETAYDLASVYATSVPARNAEAVALYLEFHKRDCRDAPTSPHRVYCGIAWTTVDKIGREHPEVGDGASPSIAPAAPPDPPPLPSARAIPERARRVGDAYTVWGASVSLRSPHHRAEVEAKRIRVTGVIGKTNLEQVPRCAWHRPGPADPEGCKPPIPTFWLCDSVDAPASDCIRVMGWASCWSHVWGAVEHSSGCDCEPYQDEFWGVAIPDPIPQRGAKLTVTGRYGLTFVGATVETVYDAVMGLLTYQELTWIRPPAGNPRLPGMTR